MTKRAKLGASVRARLLNRAKAEKAEFGLMLTRFALERLLYRLSISRHRDQFLLKLDGARCPVQADIGFGDAVTPAPEESDYPVLLDDLPAPRLPVYPRYTVIAEKFEAITSLGIANSRMKDFFDLWVLTQHSELDVAILRQAVAATFARRGTPLPAITPPVGLSDEFATDANKQTQWRAFTSRNKLDAPSLETIVNHLREFLRSLVQTTG